MEANPAKSMSARLKLNRIFLVLRFTLVLFVICCTTQIVGTFAGVFSYRDDAGALHFTDDISKIPKQYRQSEKGVRQHREARGAHRTTPTPSVPLELPGSFARNEEIQIPLIPVSGGNFLVDTVLNGRVKARLMLDTGASLITLTEEIGRKLGISQFGDSPQLPFNTAGGEEWMPLVALDTVTIGKAQTRLVEASINSHIKDIDGLLGMSFLGDFRFEIDRTNKRLTLKPSRVKGEQAWDGKSGNWWQGRFEHYDSIIKGYSSRAKFLKRRGHVKALNMQKTVDFYQDLRKKLQNRASIFGLPDRFRSSL